ncbi:hypothetical protein [Amycolatopsis sp. NPDC049159]
MTISAAGSGPAPAGQVPGRDDTEAGPSPSAVLLAAGVPPRPGTQVVAVG